MKTKRSRSRNDPTSHRRRKGISMSRDSIKAAPSKQEETKKKLKIEDRNPVTTKNPLNLPYSDLDSEQEMSNSQDTLQPKHDAKLKTNTPPSKPTETQQIGAVAGERRSKLSFLGRRHRSSFDDRQSLDITWLYIFYLATPLTKWLLKELTPGQTQKAL
jgi:hypothetical protein